MRYAFLVLLLSACGVMLPVNRERPVEYKPVVEMQGDFGEEFFGKADEVIEETKPAKPVHKVIPIGVLPPCKTDSDLEKKIIQQIECLSETANHPSIP